MTEPSFWVGWLALVLGLFVIPLAAPLISAPWGQYLAGRYLFLAVVGPLLASLVIITYFPKLVLWLPKQFLPESVGCFKNPSGAGYICP